MRRPALDAFEAEALAELGRVDRGEVALSAVGSAFRTHVVGEFVSASGWRFAVFDDSGWDYLEWVEAPDGRLWCFGDGWDVESEDESRVLMDWSPTNEDVWELAPVVPSPGHRARSSSDRRKPV